MEDHGTWDVRPYDDMDRWYMVYVYIHDDSMQQLQGYDDDSWVTAVFGHLQIIIIGLVPVYWIFILIMQRLIWCMSTHLGWLWTFWVQWDSLFSVPGTYSDDWASVGCPSAVLVCWRPGRSRDDFYPVDLGRWWWRGWSSHLFLPYYPPPGHIGALTLTAPSLQGAVWGSFTLPEAFQDW